MPVNSPHSPERYILAPQAMHALGVLLPIQFSPVKLLPGRHPLGHPGDGMRLLRTRTFVPGEDNPRDIDKFSPPGELRVLEWEDEAQASVMLLADHSASMLMRQKYGLRNACILQLTYSLWRAGDRVGTTLFDDALQPPLRAANLRVQMERLATALTARANGTGMDATRALDLYLGQYRHFQSNLVFVISDFVAAGENGMKPSTDWQRPLRQLGRNLVPVIISFKLPETHHGVVKLWDPERQRRRLTILTAERMRRINQHERDRVEALAHEFRSAGIDYLVLDDPQQVYPELARLARVRRLRKH